MKLPRNLDSLVESGRHNLDSFVETGRHNLDSLVEGGRRGAGRLYADGRGWVEDHLPDRAEVRRQAKTTGRDAEGAGRKLRHEAEDAGRKARSELRSRLERLEDRLPEPRRSGSVLWPSVVAAAGAGVAFWWWTNWARGRAEAAERAAADAAGGAEGRAHPEQVMAHNPEPAAAPTEASDRSASELSQPAEDVMAHSPPPPEVDPAKGGSGAAASGEPHGGKATADEARLLASTSAAGLAGGVDEVAPAAAVKSLDESLAVQGAASDAPAKGGRRKTGGGST